VICVDFDDDSDVEVEKDKDETNQQEGSIIVHVFLMKIQ